MSFMEDFDHLKIQMKDVVSATNNFDSIKVIGCGGFGKVYKGELSTSEGQIMAAFKQLDRRFGQGNIEFWKEVTMLSKYKHENLISLMHFCIEGNEMILVYEYASLGSVDRYLSDANTLTWIQRLKICVGAARGIHFLHDPKKTHQRVIHRDIKSANILLDENWTAKVSDFGLSKVGPANQAHTYLFSHGVGTPGYCDPLYMELGFLSKESDVYSFGVVLFEILCGRLCYEYCNGELTKILVPEWRQCYEEKRLDEIILPGLQEQVDPGSFKSFSSIAYQCVKKAREERPMMAKILEELEFSLEQQMLQERFENTPESSREEETGLLRSTQTGMAYFEAIMTLKLEGEVVAGREASSSQHLGIKAPRPHFWVDKKPKVLWKHYNSDDCPDEEFKNVFRMSKATFNMICDQLDYAVTKKDTKLRLAIPVRQRVAVCLYRLATGDSMRTISNVFMLGISTCHKVVLEVCAAIRTVLMPKFLQWPDEERLEQIKSEFRSISGMPNISGSIYTTHVPIIAQRTNTAIYLNKKHTERNQKPSYSTTIQCVVDSRGVFTDVCIGYPGSMLVEKILEKLVLSQRFNAGQLKNISIVGGSSYPLLDWLLVPHTHKNKSLDQNSFNEKIGEVQKIAKYAIMRLKGDGHAYKT